eukprot:scaffold11912_cov36-Phaeocystis_antarctica.AAC.1
MASVVVCPCLVTRMPPIAVVVASRVVVAPSRAPSSTSSTCSLTKSGPSNAAKVPPPDAKVFCPRDAARLSPAV